MLPFQGFGFEKQQSGCAGNFILVYEFLYLFFFFSSQLIDLPEIDCKERESLGRQLSEVFRQNHTGFEFDATRSSRIEKANGDQTA